MSGFSHGQFPSTRLRRTRRTATLRRLVEESALSPSDLIYPMFVLDGKNRSEPVPSMPGIERRSTDGILADVGTPGGAASPTQQLFRFGRPSKSSQNFQRLT